MSEWSYRKEITVDSAKVGGDLTDFPVLVHLDSDSDLAEHAQPSGDDIKFEDANGNQLSHEIEAYDGSTGTLWAHVKAPSLSSSSDTTLYIYYGNSGASNQENASGVWDSDFVMVHHLAESSGPALDSAGNNDGTHFGNLTTQVNGQIDGAYGLDGNDDKVEIDDPATELDPAFTVTAWFKFKAGADGSFTPIVEKNVSSNRPSPIDLRDGGGSFPKQLDIKYGDNSAINTLSSSATLSQDTWSRATVVVDDVNGGELYLNSSKVDSNTNTTFSDDNNRLIFGERTDGLGPAAIDLDEVRISSAVRSGAWVSTTYTNQNDPLSFYSVGAEEALQASKQAIATATSATTDSASQTETRDGLASAVGKTSISATLRRPTDAPVNATATTELTTALQTVSIGAFTPTALTTEVTTTTTEQARASVTTAKSTAIETKSRILKFADATATATVSLEVSVPPPSTPAAVLITASPRAALTPRETTPHRRALDGTLDTDAAYETASDRVRYDEATDEINYDTK